MFNTQRDTIENERVLTRMETLVNTIKTNNMAIVLSKKLGKDIARGEIVFIIIWQEKVNHFL